MTDEKEPDTLRQCDACGGRGCKWCSEGFQDADQQVAWRTFRKKMRAISGTYSVLVSIMNDLIDRLEALRTEESLGAAAEGRSLLIDWMAADSDSPARREASTDMTIFQKKALIILVKGRLE